MSKKKENQPNHSNFRDTEEAELNYKIIAENASDAIIRIDSGSKILFANKEAVKIFGYQIDEMLGQDLTFLMPENLRESHTKGFRRYIESNTKKLNWNRVELPGKHKDGSTISLEMSFGDYEQFGESYFVGVIRDITDRKKNLKMIKESEGVLQGTLDALTAHIAVLDNQGVIRKINKAWREFAILNGYVGDTYGVGESYLRLCHTNEEAPIECHELGMSASQGIKDVIAGKTKLFEMEYPCDSPTEQRWFIMRVTPNSDKKDPGVVVAHENITIRKLAEEKIKISEQKYRVLSEAIPAFMFVTNNEGNTTFANRQWYDYTGFTEEQTHGTGWTDAIHQDDLPDVMEKWVNTVGAKKVFESEYRLRRHDGEYRWYLVRVVPHKDTNGNILDWFGTGTDIEDRKKIEEELRSSENFNRVVLESSPDAVNIFDADGNLKYMNANGLRLMEIDNFSEYENKSWAELLNDTGRQLAIKAIEDALEGKTARFQVQSPTVKGNLKWWDIIVLSIGQNDSSDRKLRLLSVSRDITETKRISEALLESEIEQRKQAEAANRAKDDFLSVLSHELRTPLNAMLGWVRMLRTGNLNKDRADQAIEVIERNIILQNELIEDLLDVSRIISGKMLIEKEITEFTPIITNALDIARPLADKKNLEINFSNSIGFEKILGDELRLQQVVLNLLNNAVKFTEKGGLIEVDLQSDKEHLCLKVKDSGVGIAPEILPTIFERFRQADSTAKRNYSGLGLGLTIVNHITKLHSGQITAFSKGIGKGSVFTLKIPVYELTEEVETDNNLPETIHTENSYPLKNIRILLVDDDVDGIIPLQILLEQKQAIVQTANSASEAISLYSENDFDICISDIGMPNMDGYDLIKQLQNSERNSDTPTIALTAYASLTDKEKAKAHGFKRHFSKPLNFDELLNYLEELVESN